MCACVCVHVCACVSVHVCACVCVCACVLQYLEEDEEGVQLLLAAASVKVLATAVQKDTHQPHTEVGVIRIQSCRGTWPETEHSA